jgi:predicted phage terminase large subunit-like protein
MSMSVSKLLLSDCELALLNVEEKALYLEALEAKERADEQKLIASGLIADLPTFARGAWKILEPGTPLQWNWHLDYIGEHLMLCRQRRIRRLNINIPPQTMKSRYVTVIFPSWCWSLTPSERFLAASYSADLSVAHNVERRRIVESDWFQSNFPDKVAFTPDQNRKTEFENIAGGKMTATSVGGTATGRGAHYVLSDDIVSVDDADSDVKRKAGNDFWFGTLRTRLSDQIAGVFINVMQRLHETDLTGEFAVRSPGEWTNIIIPMIAERDERWEFPISGRIVERQAGEPLWPSRFPLEVCEAIKRDIGSYRWAGQYQQHPAPPEGGIIKRQWIKFYRELPAEFDEVLQSWDCTFKDTSTSDFVAGHVWARKKADFYLLYRVHERLDCPATMAAVRSTRAKFPAARAILIEDKANGPAVISMLRREISGIIPVDPQGGKESRLRAVSPLYEAGNVYVPDPSIAPWVEDVVSEWCSFPNAAHDDDCDAASQALIRLRAGSMGIVDFWRKQAEAKPKTGLTAEQQQELATTGSVAVTRQGMR